MGLVVQKYGGTSVGTTERIGNVADRIVRTVQAGNQVAVAVSAMAGETDRLIGLGKDISPVNNYWREYDVLVSTGEQVTIALLSMALMERGVQAKSLTGWQIPVHTDTQHGFAKVENIAPEKIREALEEGNVVVTPGFQGIIPETREITTLGRGGSDLSAVALAAAIEADVCEVYTDVDGVFTTDPRVVDSARKLDLISYEEMLEMAALGAKVMQARSIGFAMAYNLPIHVRSSLNDNEGTWIMSEDHVQEKLVVASIPFNRNEAKISLKRVPDTPGVATNIFKPLAEANINVDMIIQNVSEEGFTDLTFTVPKTDLASTMQLVEKVAKEAGAKEVHGDPDIAKVSIVGIGMKSHSGVASKMFETLAREGINIEMISTSEIKVSCVIKEKYTELAVRALHDAFGLAETNA